MRIRNPKINVALTVLFLLQTIVPSTTHGGERLARFKRLITETTYKGTEPAMGHDCAMECLAENIDWLEHHIDTYGSVVAKQPDIWGEARLTKHRDEYERVMFRELGNFNNTINASIRQRDGAFLAQALALSAAATNTGATPAIPENPTAGSVQVDNVVATLPGSKGAEVTDWTKFGITTDTANEQDLRIKLDPVTHLDQQSRYLKHLHELRRINEGDDTSDSPGYSLNLVRIPVSILPGKLTRQGFGAEITVTAAPVISEDLMPTTFRNLVVNDVVDLLALPLVRVTERLQTKAVVDHARASLEKAEQLLAQAKQNLQDARMAADRDMDNAQEALSRVSLLRQQANMAANTATEKQDTVEAAAAKEGLQLSLQRIESFSDIEVADLRPLEDDVVNDLSDRARAQLNGYKTAQANAIAKAKELSIARKDADLMTNEAEKSRKTVESFEVNVDQLEEAADRAENEVRKAVVLLETANAMAASAASSGMSSPTGRTRQALNPLNASNMDSVISARNIERIAEFFEPAYYGRYIRWSGGSIATDCSEHRVNLLDARRFLEAEIQAAYELLSEPAHLGLFAKLAGPNSGLAAAIRSGHLDEDLPRKTVDTFRREFFAELHKHVDTKKNNQSIEVPTNVINANSTFSDLLITQPMNEDEDEDDASTNTGLDAKNSEASSPVEALAWAIVVESALLNMRLNRDVRKLAKAKDAFSLGTTEDHWFFLPDTVTLPDHGQDMLHGQFQSANEVFKEYVRVRWPIHVFAVDPVNQDQNVADASARKRELQFALALGFASGQIGSNSLTQFSRQLQTEVETISLNRTVVGFGHGADTFGWRFYPRVQGLNAPGTLGAIRETIFGTSRDYDLRQRQIEPGQRECVAVVLMPSFVPYADFDIRTDWFKLTNPKNTALTMKDSLKLSRAITAMRNSRATCAECQHLYREGELRRLFKRVDQLDRELPLQTQRSMVPYENTLGGFEMFNTGVTDLSPELIGWYGAPGVNTIDNKCGCYQGCASVTAKCDSIENCKKLADAASKLNDVSAPLPACQGPGTTLFLVGDNFSVHDTKVIAGGVCIPQVRLISRELMQVTIPHCINTVELCENGKTNQYVAVYIATPYGVTNHLHVPVIPQDGCGGNCSSSVVNQNGSQVDASATSILRRTQRTGGIQQSAYVPERIGVSGGGLETLVRLATQIELTAQAEAQDLASDITALSTQIKNLEEGLQALDMSTNQSSVDIRITNPDPAASKEDRKWCDPKDFPLLHRFRVSSGEQWRNCRDRLPGN